MSYGVSAALQSAIYGALTDNAELQSIAGGAIYDAAPTGAVPPVYVNLGIEDAKDASDQTGQGAWHVFTVSVVAETSGFLVAKQAAALVSDALHGAVLDLTRGVLIGLWFVSAKARHGSDGMTRRIDLKFRARVEDN